MVSPKSFSPFYAETFDFSDSLEQAPACSLRTRKALLTSRLAASLLAVLLTRFRLTTMGNLFLTTFTTSILALLSKMRLHCVTFEYRSFTRRLGSVNLYLFRLLEHNSDWCSL